MLDYSRDVKPYLQLDSEGKPPMALRHPFYNASIDHRDRLRKAFAKRYPDYLDLNRPKERPAAKAYRKKIYRNPMRSLRKRIIGVLDYVRQADDFEVSFSSEKLGPDLEAYSMNKRLTKDGDLVSWFFGNVAPRYVDDPNAVLCVLPMQQPQSEQQRVDPVPMLIGCEGVFEFRSGDFAVLQAPERNWIQTPTGPKKTGVTLIFVDRDSYCIARQTTMQPVTVDGREIAAFGWEVTGLADLGDGLMEFRPPLHNCPVMPAAKIGRMKELLAEVPQITIGEYTTVESLDPGHEFFESLVSDALPHIEAAQEIQTNITVEINLHVNSEEWRYATRKCPDATATGDNQCKNGFKQVRDADGGITNMVQCEKCKGEGYTPGGTGMIFVSPPGSKTFSGEAGAQPNMPIPPGGYIPRPIEPLVQFVKEYERERRAAYETLNMQFLMQTPYDQSGVSKRYDREELYRTLINEGRHLCALLQMGFEWTGWQRYGSNEPVPAVIEPVRMSIENLELTREQLVEAIKNNFDANVRRPLEKKLISYQVGEKSPYFRRYEIKEMIDPFPDLDFEGKLFFLSAIRGLLGEQALQTYTEEVMLSLCLDSLLAAQLRQNPGFWDLSPKDQYETLMKLNRERIGQVKPVGLDAKGVPMLDPVQLQPLVDLKNINQVR